MSRRTKQSWNKKKIAVCMLGVAIVLGIGAGIIFQTRKKTVPERKVEEIVNPVNGGTKEGKWEGSHVYFGNYEQDNDLMNGKEPILWRVLQITDDEIFLLSEYSLDVMPYHDRFEDVTWENSYIRNWLNSEFLNKAFTTEEADVIKDNYNKAGHNPYYGTDAGNDTIDKVFFLSWEEVANTAYGFQKSVEVKSPYTNEDAYYCEVSDTRTCLPTEYTIANHALLTRKKITRTDPDGNEFTPYMTTYWCLRTPHESQKFIAYISRWGRTTTDIFKSPVDHMTASIRPAIVLKRSDLEFKKDSNIEDNHQKIVAVSREPEKNKPLQDLLENPVYGGNGDGKWEGKRIYYGNYEQDGEKDNGSEPVLWRVLTVEGNKALLLSEYGLEKRAFHPKAKNVKWADSEIRDWMNHEFFQSVFTIEQQNAVLETKLQATDNPRYGISGGKDTKDLMFLLSWDDVINPTYGFEEGIYHPIGEYYYGGYSDTRTCKPTTYLTQQKVSKDNSFVVLDGKNNSFNVKGKGRWWIRTPGYLDNYGMDVDSYGDIYYHEVLKVNKSKIMVRPAVWVDLEKLSVASYAKDGYPLVEATTE